MSAETGFRLPVSDMRVAVRPPTGADDLLLMEAPALDTRLALALAARLAVPADGPPDGPAGDGFDWGGLPAPDLDALLLRVRQVVVGDRVRAEATCPAAGCGRRIDVTFAVDQYLTHHTPRTPRGVKRVGAEGTADRTATDGTAAGRTAWYDLHGTAARFRLPTAADQVAVAGSADPAGDLARRCIRPDPVPASLRRRVEAAMAALAPPLSRDVAGQCPECGSAVALAFDVRAFCFREFRDRAAFVYRDVDVLAARYHWPEADILALPQARRTTYADVARQQGAIP